VRSGSKGGDDHRDGERPEDDEGRKQQNLHARGTVAAGARIEAALKPYLDAEFERAA